MTNERARLAELLAAHETWRRQTINLIASENVLSPAVRAALQSDLVGRYADYTGRDLAARRYRGNRYIELIERQVTGIAQEIFGAKHVELRPISGHVAGAAVLMGLCRPGDLVLEPGRDAGGHREAGKFAATPLVPLEIQSMPFDAGRYNIDAAQATRLIEERRPRVVILGSSNFLFPHPVAEIAEAVHRLPGCFLVYDASHVMGLLAGGRFQDPLREGADLVFGSTHKTLPGPQGGIIFTNRGDLMDAIAEATYPALVTNHHPFRIPALGLALLEMREFGAAYADQIVANAQALGESLEAEGVPCVRAAPQDALRSGQTGAAPTQSHTLLACTSRFANGAGAAETLESCGIIVTAAHLPEFWGREGVRIGVQEITHLGAREEQMASIARWIAQAISGARSPADIAEEAAAFAATLGPVRFTWPSSADASQAAVRLEAEPHGWKQDA
jgi:glycine hydroxymethyltransferase